LKHLGHEVAVQYVPENSYVSPLYVGALGWRKDVLKFETEMLVDHILKQGVTDEISDPNLKPLSVICSFLEASGQ